MFYCEIKQTTNMAWKTAEWPMLSGVLGEGQINPCDSFRSSHLLVDLYMYTL